MKAKSLKPGLLQALTRDGAEPQAASWRSNVSSWRPPLARKPFSAPLSLSTRETAAKQAAGRPIRDLGARRDDFLVELFLVELMALVQK
jgi:hypothetical protein